MELNFEPSSKENSGFSAARMMKVFDTPSSMVTSESKESPGDIVYHGG